MVQGARQGGSGGAEQREGRLFPQDPSSIPHSPVQPSPNLTWFRPGINICWLNRLGRTGF